MTLNLYFFSILQAELEGRRSQAGAWERGEVG
mgnify:FL=1